MSSSLLAWMIFITIWGAGATGYVMLMLYLHPRIYYYLKLEEWIVQYVVMALLMWPIAMILDLAVNGKYIGKERKQ